MKKKFVLVLATLMCVSLCACGGSAETNSGDKTNIQAENNSVNNTDNKTEESGKEIVISKEELATHSEYIELTTENFDDYIEIVEEEIIEKDAFGEETGRSIRVTIGLKDGCYISEDNAMRITYKYDGVNGEVWDSSMDIVFRDGYEGRETVMIKSTIFDISCEKIKGTILKLTIPNEKWNIDDDGEKYLKLDDNTMINQYTGTYESFID